MKTQLLFPRRDLYGETFKALLTAGATAAAPARVVASFNRAAAVEAKEAAKSREALLQSMTELNRTENRGILAGTAITIGTVLPTATPLYSNLTEKREELITKIINGLANQPLENVPGEVAKIDLKNRRTFFKQVWDDIKYGLAIGAIVSPVGAEAGSLYESSVAETELKTLDPNSQFLKEDERAAFITERGNVGFNHYALAVGGPVAAILMYLIPNLEIKELELIAKFIEFANTSSKNLLIKGFDLDSRKIKCTIIDQQWFDKEKKENKDFAETLDKLGNSLLLSFVPEFHLDS